jgi:ketosteroid isomerase-like protein
MKTAARPAAWKSAALAVALLLPTFAGAAAPTPEAKAATRATLHSFLKCWETGDRATFAGLLHANLVFAYPGGRFNREALLRVFDDYQKQKRDIRIYLGDMFVSDGVKHILNYQFAATDRASGKRFAVGTGVICQFTDGKISAFREYWDTGVPEQQKAGELPLDEGAPVTPWPSTVWLRPDRIN